MKHWIVVGLTSEGDELERLVVNDDKLERAIELFKDFADWVEVIDPEGRVAPRTAWARPS